MADLEEFFVYVYVLPVCPGQLLHHEKSGIGYMTQSGQLLFKKP